jgi:hypothetical protein
MPPATTLSPYAWVSEAKVSGQLRDVARGLVDDSRDIGVDTQTSLLQLFYAILQPRRADRPADVGAVLDRTFGSRSVPHPARFAVEMLRYTCF